tara:strand:- start:400 stop:576 length:177 start_codon:yes stop_codon:yes gene_type:complete
MRIEIRKVNKADEEEKKKFRESFYKKMNKLNEELNKEFGIDVTDKLIYEINKEWYGME